MPKRYLFPLGVSRRTLGIKALKCHLQWENGLTANAPLRVHSGSGKQRFSLAMLYLSVVLSSLGCELLEDV